MRPACALAIAAALAGCKSTPQWKACAAADEATPRPACSSGLDASAGPPPAASPSAPAKSAKRDLTIPPSINEPVDTASLSPEAGTNGPELAQNFSMGEAVRRALARSPQIGLASALTSEAEAGVSVARAPFFPKVEVSGGSGEGVDGLYRASSRTVIGADKLTKTNVPIKYWDNRNATGAWRTDSNMAGTQLLYDFGATSADVERAVKTRDSQALKGMATVEDVALSAAQAYASLQQSRELLALAKDNLESLKGIASLINRNEQNGNGTQADLKRVQARVADAEAIVVDQDYETKLAIERFKRLVQAEPGALRKAPDLRAALPANSNAAFDEAIKRSPRILSAVTTVQSARAEADSLRLGDLPKISAEGQADSKNFRGQNTRTDVELRLMLTMTYKLADGGLSFAKREQAGARVTQAEMKLVSEKQDVEADIRQAYLQLAAARAKAAGLSEGVASSAKARSLYREQFQGGKRSLLELLEVQSSYYTARYNQVTNAYQEQKAQLTILKSVGRLATALENNDKAPLARAPASPRKRKA
ncbi:TolC family protein [Alsobacter soli]|uniref:TolC family protein n=1 Tax=Alsobacter soli TaxID=2109933 RepID=UPI001304FA35|nr:TolC family protein [Alsobacter soli]